jgi:glycosyltransferase involved in cell wall biosynthesis
MRRAVERILIGLMQERRPRGGQAGRDVDAVLISSAFAGAGFISPAHYRRFVLPFERKVIRAIGDAEERFAEDKLRMLRAARFANSVTMDDDLQHPPEEIPRLLARLAEGDDVVYGTPIKQAHTLWRNLASYFTRLGLQGAMGVENARKVSAFRALRTQIRQAFEQYQSPFVILDVLLSWGTTRFAALPRQRRHK